MTDWISFTEQSKLELEDHLDKVLSHLPNNTVTNVAKYALLGGGHRWRALFSRGVSYIFDHKQEFKEVILAGACAVEMVHTASLILDDLPSMDNATLRRGKPCAHLVFPRWAVDMAPVLLVTTAYAIFLENPSIQPERRLIAARELSCAGIEMIKGQEIDIIESHTDRDADTILANYGLKTGVLWATATKAMAIVCGADEQDAACIHASTMNLAISYQILDDIADFTSETESIGKDSGQDSEKLTSVDVFGLEGAKQRAEWHQKCAVRELDRFGPEADFLRFLIISANLKAFA